MAFPLKDRVVVLTGAGSGIGAALARRLAAQGASLALIDVDAAGLEQTAEALRLVGCRSRGYVVDVAEAAAVAALPGLVAAELGAASVLINNAGVALAGGFEQVTAEQFDRVMRINFGGTVAMTRAFLPQLRASAPAQILVVSSIFGLVGVPGQAAYCASKFAVRGFAEALRLELAGADVGVTVVHPGGVRTNIAKAAEIGPGVSAQARASRLVTAEKLLRLSPEAAAERMVKAIGRRERRVLVGKDARLLAALQRAFPVSYGRLFPSGS